MALTSPAVGCDPVDVTMMRHALALARRAIGLSDPNPRVGCIIAPRGTRPMPTTGAIDPLDAIDTLDGSRGPDRAGAPAFPLAGCIGGWTRQAGREHAEADALARARRAGIDLHGATAWVTLEPCSHTGRTPPCADALIGAGIARVVIGTLDPNPLVSGRGAQRLQDAGVDVRVCCLAPWHADPQAPWATVLHALTAFHALHAPQAHGTCGPDARGACDPAARDASPMAAGAPAAMGGASACLLSDLLDLNIGFFSRMRRSRPWVRVKLAASLDGRTALPDGRSQWITSAAARQDGHRWRARAGAIVTGIGTVLADDPRLDVRVERDPAAPAAPPPLRVVVDSRWRTPPTARLLTLPGPVAIVGRMPDDTPAAHRLRAAGARTVALDGPGETPDSEAAVAHDGSDRARPSVDPVALLAWLSAQPLNEVHVEAGPALSGALLSTAGVVDELLLYQAPMLVGAGRPLADLPSVAGLDDAPRGRGLAIDAVGPDLRWRLLWEPVPDDSAAPMRRSG